MNLFKKAFILLLVFPAFVHSQISITSLTFTYSQDFNSLANSGTDIEWNDNTTIIGWYSNKTTYNTGTGSSTTGSLYSFGEASSSERALGSLASSSNDYIYGIRFINNSGEMLTQIPISYTGEQWRGASTTEHHKLDFQYQIDAEGINSGTWIDFDNLDFTGPISGMVGALDGNDAANQVNLSSTINLSLDNGQEIWFRWVDVDDASTDHGLAIDDFELNPDQEAMPVELTSFTASVINNQVHLCWNTATEISNYGFDIERKDDTGLFYKLGFVRGSGNSNSEKEYGFVDKNISLVDKCFYRLKQIDTDGSLSYSKVVEVDLTSPLKYDLSQNYPNPFNPVTTINYTIPEAANVKISIYNLLGELVFTLVDEFKEAGNYSAILNREGLGCGTYFYKLQTKVFTEVRKMIILK